MRRHALLLFACSLLAAPAVRGDDKASPARPFGLTKRVPWTSRIAGSPEPPPPYRLGRTSSPRSSSRGRSASPRSRIPTGCWWARTTGKIYSFSLDAPDADRPELFLDIKRSLYAFSFHPRYKENGQVFVFSPTPAEGTPGPPMSRVSRFETGLRTRGESDPVPSGSSSNGPRAGTTAARRSSGPTDISTSPRATVPAAPTSTTRARGSTICCRS